MNFNVNMELLKAFYVVAKEKNITKACEKLMISQSAVSKAIKNIETQLGCQLFIRSKKGVELTNDGKILLESTEKIFNILNNDLGKINKTNSINILAGKVIIDQILYPYINTFKEKYPDVKISLSSNNIDGILESLKNQETDLAIGYFINDLDEVFEQKKILKELHPIFVCNESYKDLINKKLNISSLEKYPYIISAKGSTTHEYAINFFKDNKLNITPAMEVLGTSLIIQLVEKGFGISILTKEFIEEELDNNKLYKVNLNKELKSRNLYLLTYKNRTFSKEINYMIDLLTNNDI